MRVTYDSTSKTFTIYEVNELQLRYLIAGIVYTPDDWNPYRERPNDLDEMYNPMDAGLIAAGLPSYTEGR